MFLAVKPLVRGHKTPILFAVIWKSRPAPLPFEIPTINESAKVIPSLLKFATWD